MCPREFTVFIGWHLTAQEVHVAACQLASLLLCVDVAESHQRGFVAAEAILFHEERHEDTVDFQDEVFRFSPIEDIVAEMEEHLAFHAMRLADASYLVDIFFLNH